MVFCLFLVIQNKRKKWDIFDFILLITLIIFSAIRYGIGIDYNLYKKIFDNIYLLSDMSTNRTGVGFSYFMYFVKNILHGNFQIVIAICSIITNFFMYYFFKKNSKRPGLSILLYLSLGFYTTSFNMFRQMLSMSFLLIGFNLFKNKKKFFSLIAFIIATFIHSTSLLAILVYLFLIIFKKINLTPKILFPIGIVAVFLYDTIFNIIIKMIPSMGLYIDYSSLPGVGTYINVAVYLIIALLIMSKRKKIEILNHDGKLFCNAVVIGATVMLLELKNYLFFRIAYYFIIFIPILLVDYYETASFRTKKINSLAFYMCLLIYFLIYVFSFDGVIPYKTILELW